MSQIGRNDPCHCGSKKKYKKCHLEKDEKADAKKRQKASLNAAKVAAEEEKKAAATSHGEDPKQRNWFRKLAHKMPFFKNRVSPSTRHK